jgi:hypothetical protein
MIDLVIYRRRGVWRVARLGRSDYAHVNIVVNAWWKSAQGYWWVRFARSKLPEAWQPRGLAVAANFAFLRPRWLLVTWLIGGERALEQFSALVADHLSHVRKEEAAGVWNAMLWRIRLRHFADCCSLSISCSLDSLRRALHSFIR